MSKKIIINFVIVIGLFLLAIVLFPENGNKVSLIDINTVELNELVTKGEGVYIYIGRPTCSVCVEFTEILEKNLEGEVYYYNTDEGRSENEEGMREIMDILGIVAVPTIIYIDKGEIQGMGVGMQSEENLILFLNGDLDSLNN